MVYSLVEMVAERKCFAAKRFARTLGRMAVTKDQARPGPGLARPAPPAGSGGAKKQKAKPRRRGDSDAAPSCRPTAVLLDCSKSSGQCSLSYLLTYLLVLGALSSCPVHRTLVLVLGTHIAASLDCSESSRQCGLYYSLLTVFTAAQPWPRPSTSMFAR